MEDRRSGTKDRRSAWKPRTIRRAHAEPGPDPAPPTVPGPIPWIPTGAASEVTRGARSYTLCAIDGGAATGSEPAIQSSIPEAFRHLPLRLRLVEPPATDAPRPLTVLLVDDNHHHRIPLLRALRAETYNVLYAADGARGEDLFRTSLREIDALIACGEMRRMSGFELARSVRSARPEIAVLLMGRPLTSPERADSPFERGFPVIEEPFAPEQLTRRLAEVLAASRSKDCPE
jgi:CheY-like chemotaxis protein